VSTDDTDVMLTNLSKPFWPDDGYTKGDLVAYYLEIAPYLLPHLNDRRLTLTRYPDGIHGHRFYQKNVPAVAPAWLRRAPYLHGSRTVNYCVADRPAALVWLAQWGVIELHPWLSRIASPETPDFAVFDLDPTPPCGLAEAVEVARLIRTVLDGLGLRAYPKTSGATGLHLYLPLCPGYDYPTAAGLVARVADLIHRACPDLTTRERPVARRSGVYIDHLQNAQGKTLVASYSLRPLRGAPVSTPLHWDELAGLRAEKFTLRSVPERLRRMGDLFAPVLEDRQDVDRALRELGMK